MKEAKCPVCGTMFSDSNGARRSFPFCSQRCKDADLGRWFGEQYSVPIQDERVLREAEEAVDDDLEQP